MRSLCPSQLLMRHGGKTTVEEISSIAEAGYRRVCLVIGADHAQVRDYYSGLACQRLRIEFAVQPEQLGTANALACAEDFAGGHDVLVLNGDNCYPAEALRALREASGSAVVGFDARALIAESNIPAERLAAFAVLKRSRDGHLENIIEKPSSVLVEEHNTSASSYPLLISMNCWHFRPPIFLACRATRPSPRGEYELPDAVMYTIREMGERYRVIPLSAGVLDLSSRSDIEGIQQRLEKKQVRL